MRILVKRLSSSGHLSVLSAGYKGFISLIYCDHYSMHQRGAREQLSNTIFTEAGAHFARMPPNQQIDARITQMRIVFLVS